MIKIYNFNEIEKDKILTRMSPAAGVEDKVASILADVRENGDAALFKYCEMFDGVKLGSLEVTQDEIAEAFESLESSDPGFLDILRRAEESIRRFHEQQKRGGFTITSGGAVLGQRVLPIEKAGIYVPGGTAAYPSTVLMDSVPAKIAGCSEIVMVTPPMKNDKVNPAILAAAKIAGVTRIFKLGGAQAVAALAYGTESVPKVDKIVGPGNAYVAEAKKQVYGLVSIDMIAGPSEILVIADKNSSPKNVAADLLSQAEHDRLASAVLVTDSADLAKAVQAEIERQLPLLDREEIARASIENNGKIIVTESIREATEAANSLAPEHLELCVDAPFDYLDLIKNAGSVFLGRYTPEALGDYMAGPNHTLPTGGTARFSSPLSVDDFTKKSQFIYYSAEEYEKTARDVEAFAKKEGLTAHARSAVVRLEDE
ncbi:MAG: histidinol dehydrogenase [Eubacteriales bacterium]